MTNKQQMIKDAPVETMRVESMMDDQSNHTTEGVANFNSVQVIKNKKESHKDTYANPFKKENIGKN